MARARSRKPLPAPPATTPRLVIERVQTGVRLEKRMLKVLKALAECHDTTLGELLEEVVLHAFEGESAFGPKSRERIASLKRVYGIDYDTHASYRFAESDAAAPHP